MRKKIFLFLESILNSDHENTPSYKLNLRPRNFRRHSRKFQQFFDRSYFLDWLRKRTKLSNKFAIPV